MFLTSDQSKNTLSILSISEEYLLSSVRLVKSGLFFWINLKRRLDVKDWFLETEIFYLPSWYETLDIKTVMSWTRSSNLLAAPNTAADLFHLDKHWLMAVFSAECTQGKDDISAIRNALQVAILLLGTGFSFSLMLELHWETHGVFQHCNGWQTEDFPLCLIPNQHMAAWNLVLMKHKPMAISLTLSLRWRSSNALIGAWVLSSPHDVLFSSITSI